MLKERLVKLRADKGLSQYELAKNLNLSRGQISNYELGSRQPDYDTLKIIASYFDVSTDYLLGTTDEPLTIQGIIRKLLRGEELSDEESEQIRPILEANELRMLLENQGIKHLPLLGSIRAGLPILAEENIEGHLDVPGYFLADYALRVTGDSMIGAGILEGDYAICRESNMPQTGQIVVALRDEGSISEATLKFYANGNGSPKLRAANPNYADIDYTDGYRTAGHMVALVRDEAPGYQVYKNYIAVPEYEEWTEIIEMAVAAGMKVEHVKEIVSAQIEIAKKFKGID